MLLQTETIFTKGEKRDKIVLLYRDIDICDVFIISDSTTCRIRCSPGLMVKKQLLGLTCKQTISGWSVHCLVRLLASINYRQ